MSVAIILTGARRTRNFSTKLKKHRQSLCAVSHLFSCISKIFVSSAFTAYKKCIGSTAKRKSVEIGWTPHVHKEKWKICAKWRN